MGQLEYTAGQHGVHLAGDNNKGPEVAHNNFALPTNICCSMTSTHCSSMYVPSIKHTMQTHARYFKHEHHTLEVQTPPLLKEHLHYGRRLRLSSHLHLSKHQHSLRVSVTQAPPTSLFRKGLMYLSHSAYATLRRSVIAFEATAEREQRGHEVGEIREWEKLLLKKAFAREGSRHLDKHNRKPGGKRMPAGYRCWKVKAWAAMQMQWSTAVQILKITRMFGKACYRPRIASK